MTNSIWLGRATALQLEKAKMQADEAGVEPEKLLVDFDSLKATLFDLGQQMIAAFGPEETGTETFEKLQERFREEKAKHLVIILAFENWMSKNNCLDLGDPGYMKIVSLWNYADDFEGQIRVYLRRIENRPY